LENIAPFPSNLKDTTLPICCHSSLNWVLVQCLRWGIKEKISALFFTTNQDEELKECITRTMETRKEQGEHCANHGKVKTKEDIDVTAMNQFKKD
jgi:hypothetical protein